MTILAAVDVDHAPEEPIVVGYDLATTYDEPLVAMYVVTDEEYQERRRSREEVPEEFRGETFTLEQALESIGQEVAEVVEEALGSSDTERVEPRGRVGDPADEILTAAEELDPRFVVVGGRNRSPARQAIFGSVSQTIVRKATQPVVTVVESQE